MAPALFDAAGVAGRELDFPTRLTRGRVESFQSFPSSDAVKEIHLIADHDRPRKSGPNRVTP